MRDLSGVDKAKYENLIGLNFHVYIYTLKILFSIIFIY